MPHAHAPRAQCAGEAPRASWCHATAPGVSALAVLELTGDIDAALATCGIKPVGVGQVALRDFFGVDAGIVARFTDAHAHLMPHGGPAVVRGVIHGLLRAGIVQSVAGEYPEARTPAEARALAALSGAASPLAVDAILARLQTWDDPTERALRHLIRPPLVVAVGRPNIGKSSLVNALAQRCVSIVADEEGTTRDHVGVRLDLAGLVVDYVDTPGLPDTPTADPIQAAATRLALDVAARADLVLVCRDSRSLPPTLPAEVASRESVHVGLRSDIGRAGGDLWVSAKTGDGLDRLVEAVMSRLVPVL